MNKYLISQYTAKPHRPFLWFSLTISCALIQPTDNKSCLYTTALQFTLFHEHHISFCMLRLHKIAIIQNIFHTILPTPIQSPLSLIPSTSEKYTLNQFLLTHCLYMFKPIQYTLFTSLNHTFLTNTILFNLIISYLINLHTTYCPQASISFSTHPPSPILNFAMKYTLHPYNTVGTGILSDISIFALRLLTLFNPSMDPGP